MGSSASPSRRLAGAFVGSPLDHARGTLEWCTTIRLGLPKGLRADVVHAFVRLTPRHARAQLLLAAIAASGLHGETISVDTEVFVTRLFRTEGRSLVRLARLYVDDRDAAEDLVQEAFLRIARHAHAIESTDRAPAYLRSIVLNLARDHNRRGLVSLRHQATQGRDIDVGIDPGDRLVRSEEHQRIIDAVGRLPTRQRDCITLRYFEELAIEQIAVTLGISANSVKTHLQRAMTALDRQLSE